MASASTAVSFGFRFSPLCSRPSVRVSHTSVRLASFNKANSLRLGSSHNISGFGIALLQKPCHIAAPSSQVRSPLTVVAAKGYKMKTHKASAKRFRVTGRGENCSEESRKAAFTVQEEHKEEITAFQNAPSEPE